MKITETDRLLLRHFELLDDQAMNAVFGDPEVMKFGDGLLSAEAVKEWLVNCANNFYNKWGYGPWAVVCKKTSKVMGYCGLFFFPDINGREEIEIGYRFAKEFWGRGYATEAAIAVREHAFSTLSISRLIAMVDPDNTASIRVAEKIGMVHTSNVMLSEHWTHPDRVYVIESSHDKH